MNGDEGIKIPNIKDVAKHTGLSVSTVSRVLNNRGYISAKTRKAVENAMAELNYHPNELARSLFRQRSNILGVIMPSVDHPFFAALLQAIEYHASAAGFKIMISISREDARKEIEYLQMLQCNKVDGIILSSRYADIRAHLNNQFPFVTIDRVLGEHIPCIASDNYQGGVLATRHLIERGCKKLAHITGTPGLQLLANLRDTAFVDTCRKNGIEPIVIVSTEEEFSDLNYYRALEQLLDEHEVDGLFLSNDTMAAQAIQLAHRKGIRIPEQLKIVGFDDVPLSRFCSPAITTIRQPVYEIGKYAVDAIVNRLNDMAVPERILLPVALVQRETT